MQTHSISLFLEKEGSSNNINCIISFDCEMESPKKIKAGYMPLKTTKQLKSAAGNVASSSQLENSGACSL